MSNFQDLWSRWRPGQWPVGYRLRQDGAANWIRFHSMPGSKRYAESDEERRVILQRQNALAAEALGAGPCWLVQAHWEMPEGVVDLAEANEPFAATRDWGLKPAFEMTEPDGEGGADLWRVHAGRTQWVEARFDDLLTAIAEERAGPTLWMAEETGAVFAPYDGGVDLFLAEAAQVEALRARHAGWLSAHTEGL